MKNNKSDKGYRCVLGEQTPFEIGIVLFPFVGEECETD